VVRCREILISGKWEGDSQAVSKPRPFVSCSLIYLNGKGYTFREDMNCNRCVREVLLALQLLTLDQLRGEQNGIQYYLKVCHMVNTARVEKKTLESYLGLQNKM
jgi:hypothetical protein